MMKNDKNNLMTVNNLRCEYLRQPLAIITLYPRLSWVIKSENSCVKQTARQIIVASTLELLSEDKGDLWDSGKIESSRSIHIEYKGKPLQSRQRCYWKVRVWDNNSNQSLWSQSSFWQVGLLEKTDWSAKWIHPAADQIQRSEQDTAIIASPLMRKTFNLSKSTNRAAVYVTARGLYQLYLNGKRVGCDHLTPGFDDKLWQTVQSEDISPNRMIQKTKDIKPINEFLGKFFIKKTTIMVFIS